jgi:hypothetical protein
MTKKPNQEGKPTLRRDGEKGHTPSRPSKSSRKRVEEQLDEALEQSFPASDPPGVSVDRGD